MGVAAPGKKCHKKHTGYELGAGCPDFFILIITHDHFQVLEPFPNMNLTLTPSSTEFANCFDWRVMHRRSTPRQIKKGQLPKRSSKPIVSVTSYGQLFLFYPWCWYIRYYYYTSLLTWPGIPIHNGPKTWTLLSFLPWPMGFKFRFELLWSSWWSYVVDSSIDWRSLLAAL